MGLLAGKRPYTTEAKWLGRVPAVRGWREWVCCASSRTVSQLFWE